VAGAAAPGAEARPRSAFGLEPLAGAESLSAPEFVYRQIFDAVMAQRLLPGARLQEETLAGIFGIGRATIRATLQRLGHDGVVELRTNRGAIVARPRIEEVRDVLDARRVIERELVRRVAERHGTRHEPDGSAPEARSPGVSVLDAEPFASVAALAREEGDHLAAGRRGAALRLAGEFHVALARLGGNRSLTEALRRLVTRTALAIGAYERVGHEFAGWRSRLELLGTVASGDGSGAASAVTRHLDRLEASMELESSGASPPALDDVFVPFGRERSS